MIQKSIEKYFGIVRLQVVDKKPPDSKDDPNSGKLWASHYTVLNTGFVTY